jgi:hypothetical protein
MSWRDMRPAAPERAPACSTGSGRPARPVAQGEPPPLRTLGDAGQVAPHGEHDAEIDILTVRRVVEAVIGRARDQRDGDRTKGRCDTAAAPGAHNG